MLGRCEEDFRAVRANGVGDLLTVRGNDAAARDVKRLDALPHSDDEWQTGEEAKGFSGEAARAQSSWDHGERLHARRSAGQGWAASVTSSNVFGVGISG